MKDEGRHAPPAFACDNMLGRLARWLRASGYDVFYHPTLERSSLLRLAREQGRIILTRAGDYGRLSDIPPFFVVKGDLLDEQLKQVYGAYPDLDPFFAFLSRCLLCNALLEDIDKELYRAVIPHKAFLLEGSFRRCPACQKIYWPGSHVSRMKSRLEHLGGS